MMPVMILMKGLTVNPDTLIMMTQLRDYEDVEEDERYYVPFPPDVVGVFFSTGTAFEVNTDPIVVASVGCVTQPVGVPG